MIDDTRLRFTGPPEWRLERKVSAKSRLPDEPFVVLFDDIQCRVESAERYRRMVVKVQDDSALERCARIEIPFHLSHQILSVHQLKIWRGRESINACARECFRAHTENGMALGAEIRIGDVRVGDVIDLSYTVSEDDRSYTDHFHLDQVLEWPLSVQQFHLTLHVPKGRRLRMRYRKAKLAPEVEKRGDGGHQLTWSQTDVRGVNVEPGAPSWFNPFQSVELTDLGSWSELAKWAGAKWTIPESGPGAALAAVIDGIEASCDTTEKRAREAVAFVQNEVRTVGLSPDFGPSCPTSPDIVFEERRGDSRDKSLLLCAMLGALGIWARPALVNTTIGRRIEKSLPALGAFDRVIAVFALDGRSRWVDPTHRGERGDMNDRANPMYGRGLVIDEETDGLSDIAHDPLHSGSEEIWETFFIDETPVRLKSRIVWTGAEAARVRREIGLIGNYGFASRCEDEYRQSYPEIEVAHSFEISDDEQHDKITASGEFLIEGLAVAGEEPDEEAFQFHADPIGRRLPVADVPSRTSPLALAYPLVVKHHIDVHGTMSGMTQDQSDCETAEYAFRVLRTPTRRGLRLDFEYTAKRDHVNAAEYAAFVSDLGRVVRDLEYTLVLPRDRKRTLGRQGLEDDLELPDPFSSVPTQGADSLDDGLDPKRVRAHQMWEAAREGADEPQKERWKAVSHGSRLKRLSPKMVKIVCVVSAVTIAVLIKLMSSKNGSNRAAAAANPNPRKALANEDAKIGGEENFQLARSAFMRGDYAESLRLIDALREDFPDNAERLYLEAFVEFRMNRVDKAAALTDRSLARNPENSNALALRGFISRAKGDHLASVKAFHEATAHSPDNAELYRQWGLSLEMMNRPGDAVKAMEKARSLRPDHIDTIIPLAILYEQLGEHSKVNEVIEGAVQAMSDRGPVWLFYAEYLLRQNDLKDALWAGKNALEYNDDDPEVFATVGRIHLMNDDVAGAEELFDRGLRLKPRHPALLYGKGICLMENEDFEEAISHFEGALELNPTNAAALNNIGAAYIQLEKPKEAYRYIAKALEVDPGNANARTNLGILRERGVVPSGGESVPEVPPTPPGVKNDDEGWLPIDPGGNAGGGR